MDAAQHQVGHHGDGSGPRGGQRARGLVLVRHASAEIDAAVPPALWPLTDAGRAAARARARAPAWREVRRLFTSPERKAAGTTYIIAGPRAITVTAVEELREVERPTGRWLADYPTAVAAWLAQPGEPVHGWKPAEAAFERICACIARLRGLEAEPFAVVGHGLTLSLDVAALTGQAPLTVWDTLRMPGMAVVDVPSGRIVRPFGSG
jgi:broad specificity phosphatase PhoE